MMVLLAETGRADGEAGLERKKISFASLFSVSWQQNEMQTSNWKSRTI